MEQTVKKLKTVDVDYYDKHSGETNLFFDVIDHRFEDDFLVMQLSTIKNIPKIL